MSEELENTEEYSETNEDTAPAPSLKSEIISWVLFISASIICAVLINSFIIFNAHIPSASMENTIMTGDRIIGLRITYFLQKPERYDVAIFRFPDNEEEYYVKRVIGLPGEVLEIIDGKVYIDGSDTPLDDSFLKEESLPDMLGPYEVPEGSYFMLGDNRNMSADSRFWVDKFVQEDKILAKAYVCLWPKPRLIK